MFAPDATVASRDVSHSIPEASLVSQSSDGEWPSYVQPVNISSSLVSLYSSHNVYVIHTDPSKLVNCWLLCLQYIYVNILYICSSQSWRDTLHFSNQYGAPAWYSGGSWACVSEQNRSTLDKIEFSPPWESWCGHQSHQKSTAWFVFDLDRRSPIRLTLLSLFIFS